MTRASDDIRASDDVCACGHIREAHQHFRRGSDCGVCGRVGCRRFRRQATAQAATPIEPTDEGTAVATS
jgi:hypothetical protein